MRLSQYDIFYHAGHHVKKDIEAKNHRTLGIGNTQQIVDALK